MLRMTEGTMQAMFGMFASGEAVERVAEAFEISARRAKWWYQRYLELPMGEKLRAVMRPELVADRMHRLMDDLKDIERLDVALLSAGDEKALAALLDMKRKIKERMAKDLGCAAERAPELDAGLEDEISEFYKKLFGDTSN